MNPDDLKKQLEGLIAQSADQDPERVAKRKSIVEKMMGSMAGLKDELAKIKQTAEAMSRPARPSRELAQDRMAQEIAHFEEVKRISQEQCDLLETIVERSKARKA